MHRGQDRVGEGTRPGDKPKAPAGNGRAVAMLAACEGASVACADVSPSAAAATAALFGEEGARRLPVIGDATDPGQSSAMFAEALRELGALHAVVVNVGIGLGAGLTDTSPQRWERELSLNLSAPFLAAQYGYGLPAAVFVDSVAGLRVEYQQHVVADVDRERRDLLDQLLAGVAPTRGPLFAAAQAYDIGLRSPMMAVVAVCVGDTHTGDCTSAENGYARTGAHRFTSRAPANRARHHTERAARPH
ncbi:SDR family NAD(P)-dependent oxidoreductase [Streptomyces mirabilis]|uniref:SDR family NAD(P)-dependent oxidoreductase n=1 Tax=Streptomyces mirabilis TaxID=68239 RepID=UPI003334979F